MIIEQEIPGSLVKLGFLVFQLLYKRGSQMAIRRLAAESFSSQRI